MGAGNEKRQRAKAGKLDVGRFTVLPHSVIHSVEYRTLGFSARALLIDIAAQYTGKNNGKLVACDSYLKPLKWNSNGTISNALKELKASGLLIQTRQGMKPPYKQVAWFALGWFGLDVTEGIDFSPRAYRRFVATPIKPLTPKNGVVK